MTMLETALKYNHCGISGYNVINIQRTCSVYQININQNTLLRQIIGVVSLLMCKRWVKCLLLSLIWVYANISVSSSSPISGIFYL